MKNLFSLWFFLDNKDKKSFYLIVFFSLLQGILEMLGIAVIIPFMTLLLNPEADFINCSIIYCDGGESRSGAF